MVVVSGGQGRNEDISEAAAMKRYLVSKGVVAEQIIEENRSHNTNQNFEYSKELIDNRFSSTFHSIACITSNYHAYRAKKIAEKAGLSVAQFNSTSRWYLYPSAYFREMLSIFKLWTSK